MTEGRLPGVFGGSVAAFLCSHVGTPGGVSMARSTSASRGRRTLCDTLMLPFLSRPTTFTCSFWPRCRCCSMDLTCIQDSEIFQPIHAKRILEHGAEQLWASIGTGQAATRQEAYLKASPVKLHWCRHI